VDTSLARLYPPYIFYEKKFTVEVALLFVDALEQTYRQIQQRPTIGSPRYAHELNLPGLRFRQCKRFPYLVFYVEYAQQIDIWRVLHGSRDISVWLQGEV
jgi:toxin ParE1/3/4